jgi:hypothetical protein
VHLTGTTARHDERFTEEVDAEVRAGLRDVVDSTERHPPAPEQTLALEVEQLVGAVCTGRERHRCVGNGNGTRRPDVVEQGHRALLVRRRHTQDASDGTDTGFRRGFAVVNAGEDGQSAIVTAPAGTMSA